MAKSNNADGEIGFTLNMGENQLPKFNAPDAQLEFLISMFFSNKEFNAVELFCAGNMADVKVGDGSST